MVRLGAVGHGSVWLGSYGKASYGKFWLGKEWQFRFVRARCGTVWSGMVRQGKAVLAGSG